VAIFVSAPIGFTTKRGAFPIDVLKKSFLS
jgi:hypothetical protein